MKLHGKAREHVQVDGGCGTAVAELLVQGNLCCCNFLHSPAWARTAGSSNPPSIWRNAGDSKEEEIFISLDWGRIGAESQPEQHTALHCNLT